MWKQAHFIHRSGNLTDKHLDCVWIWSRAAIVRTQAPVSCPLLAQRLHPVHRPPRPREPSSSLFCSVWKCQILLGKPSSLDWWKRWHNSVVSSEPSKVLIRRIQTIGGYERHARPHTFAFYKFAFSGILVNDPYYCLHNCSDLDQQMDRKHFIYTSFALCNKKWCVFAFRLLFHITKYIF